MATSVGRPRWARELDEQLPQVFGEQSTNWREPIESGRRASISSIVPRTS